MKRPFVLTLSCALCVLSACEPQATAQLTTPAPESASTGTSSDQLFGLNKVGVREPANGYQRYRRAEYPSDKGFYQWWFFTLRDVATQQYFTFTYSMMDAVTDPTRSSARMMFSATDQASGTRFRKSEIFPLAQMSVSNDFDVQLFSDAAKSRAVHSIQALADGQWRIRGQMVAPTSQVEAAGTLDGEAVDAAVPVSWDLSIERIYGWYGENNLEKISQTLGTISWNTYGHESRVTGTLTVGTHTFTVESTPDWRMYCDMNWGIEFPRGQASENQLDYPWGWFYVAVPNADVSKEISLIAGVGTQHLNDIETGSFSDVRLGGELGGFQFKGIETLKPAPDKAGVRLYDSSDSLGTKFEVTRDQWTSITDENGTATLPLHQQVVITTLKWNATLDFYSSLDDYIRLPFVAEAYTFSDFEALGVNVHAVVTKRDSLGGKARTVADFWSNAGGVEFGYRAPFQ